MKKVILSLVVVAALSTVSCKKNYNCVCTITETGVANITTTTVIDNTKSKATTACTALNSTVGTIATTCAIQ